MIKVLTVISAFICFAFGAIGEGVLLLIIAMYL